MRREETWTTVVGSGERTNPRRTCKISRAASDCTGARAENVDSYVAGKYGCKKYARAVEKWFVILGCGVRNVTIEVGTYEASGLKKSYIELGAR
jgi:hypothetical protein